MKLDTRTCWRAGAEGDADRAFEGLAKAKATGKMDNAEMQVDSDLVALEDDPRFAALLQSLGSHVRDFERREEGKLESPQFSRTIRNRLSRWTVGPLPA